MPNTLTMTRTLSANPARVFAAWTRAESLKKWFCPGKDMTVPVAEVDLRVGGGYRIVMQNKDGETYSPSGTFEKIEPDALLVFTWKWADSELVTRVTVKLEALGPEQTQLTLIHEGFPESEIRDRHSEGWTGCLDRLHDYLH